MTASTSPSQSVPGADPGAVPALEVENLWKKYGFRLALSRVSLELDTGDCLALFGANGAGKSTLLKILATRTAPTSGRGTIFGQDLVRQRGAIRGDLGVVFHESALRSDLTLDENLRFYASLYGRSRLSEATEELVETLGLGDRRREPVRNFSRGMIQRATLIRSLVHDPRLWLLDEPFTGLDPRGREQLAGVIRAEHERGRTIVFITHDIERGLGLASRSACLRSGELVSEDPDEIRQILLEEEPTGEDPS